MLQKGDAKMNKDTIIRLLSFCLILATLSTMTSGLLLGRTARRSRKADLEIITTVRSDLEEAAVLRIEMESSEDYEALKRKASRRQVRYDSRMNKHREELSVFTATRSGMQQGAEAMRSADKELQSGKQIYQIIDNLLYLAEFLFEPVDILIAALDTNQDGIPDPDVERDLELALAYLRETDLEELKSLLQQMQAELAQYPSELQEQGIDPSALWFLLDTLAGSVDHLKVWINDPSLTAESLLDHFSDLVAVSSFMHTTRIVMDYLGWQITEGETELNKAKAAIREEEAKLDETARRLETEKAWLDMEEQRLLRQKQEAEDQKTREDRLNAICSYLRGIPEIRDGLEEDAEETPSNLEEKPAIESSEERLFRTAEGWLAAFTEESRTVHTRRIVCMVLMLLPLLCAALGFTISFREKRWRCLEFFLFLICLLSSMAAGTFYLQENRGVSYACIAVAMLSVLCIVFSFPVRKREKRPAV